MVIHYNCSLRHKSLFPVVGRDLLFQSCLIEIGLDPLFCMGILVKLPAEYFRVTSFW